MRLLLLHAGPEQLDPELPRHDGPGPAPGPASPQCVGATACDKSVDSIPALKRIAQGTYDPQFMSVTDTMHSAAFAQTHKHDLAGSGSSRWAASPQIVTRSSGATGTAPAGVGGAIGVGAGVGGVTATLTRA